MADQSSQFGGGAGTFGTQFGASLTSHVKQIISDALTASGINSVNSNYREKALIMINHNYLTILKGRHWKFMQREIFAELTAPYIDGTVKLIQGSHVIEEDIVAPATTAIAFKSTMMGQLICPTTTTQSYYRINNVTSSTKLEIVPGFAEVSADNSSYRILFDRIHLDSKVQEIRSLTIAGQREIKPVGSQRFRIMKSSDPCRTGVPEFFTTIKSDRQDGGITVELYPSPDKQYAVHMDYSERPTRLEDSKTCFPLIPSEHSDVLFLALQASIYRDQNNAVMAADFGKQAASAWSRMAADRELTDSRGRLQVGKNYFQRRGRRAHTTSLGLKWFGRFD